MLNDAVLDARAGAIGQTTMGGTAARNLNEPRQSGVMDITIGEMQQISARIMQTAFSLEAVADRVFGSIPSQDGSDKQAATGYSPNGQAIELSLAIEHAKAALLRLESQAARMDRL